MGFRPARLFAVTSGLIELGGGLLLAVGFLTPIAAAALVAQAVVIIGQVHWSHGFFNSKSGIEFPLLLGLGAAAVGLSGGSTLSVDGALGIAVDPAIRLGLIVLGIAAGFVALEIPRLTTHAATSA